MGWKEDAGIAYFFEEEEHNFQKCQTVGHLSSNPIKKNSRARSQDMCD